MPTESQSGVVARGLERFLSAQLQRLRLRFLVHGLGWMVAAVAAATLLYYAFDRWLRLPAPVRIAVSIAVLAYLLYGLRRRLTYPLSRRLHRDDIAVAIEHRFPELRDRLISAVQLNDSLTRSQGGDAAVLRNQSPAMIERLVADAAEALQRIPVRDWLSPRRTTRVWAIAGGLALVLAVTALLGPTAFGVFLQRTIGRDASYPRLTTLHVELPDSGDEYRIERNGNVAHVTLAEGADLPVLVRVEGRVPREVTLGIEGGRGMAPEVAMTARSSDRFRHVFRRVREAFAFHAMGGDDDRGDLRVEVATVRPPRVGTIRARLEYPSYTALEPVTQAGGNLEALEGTQVELQVTTTAPVHDAALTFLESGREEPLKLESVTDDDGTHQVLIGRFTIQSSDRYQVRLLDRSGLRNPHPGTYPVVAVSDLPPNGRLLSPGEDELAVVVPDGIVPMRLEARDDFGLAAVDALLEVGKAATEVKVPLLNAEKTRQPLLQTVALRLFDVAKLPAPNAVVSVGDSITVSAALTDNRAPQASTTELPSRHVYVVGQADLARRISGHFRRVRDGVEELRDLQSSLLSRLQDVIESAGDPNVDVAPLRNDVTVAQVGQARVQSNAQRLHVDLMRAFDVHLFNNLEDSPHAAQVLELYAKMYQDASTPFVPDFYREVDRERKTGRIGAMPKALDPILEMTLAMGRIGDELAPAAVAALDRASVAPSIAAAGDDLAEAVRLQRESVQSLDHLLEMLAQWNEFQDVIIQTRSLLEKQREVEVRTLDALRKPDEPEGGRR